MRLTGIAQGIFTVVVKEVEASGGTFDERGRPGNVKYGQKRDFIELEWVYVFIAIGSLEILRSNAWLESPFHLVARRLHPGWQRMNVYYIEQRHQFQGQKRPNRMTWATVARPDTLKPRRQLPGTARPLYGLREPFYSHCASVRGRNQLR